MNYLTVSFVELLFADDRRNFVLLPVRIRISKVMKLRSVEA